jgi:hypothetical protein
MIKYSLNCPKGHTFEGWFRSSDAFDGEVKRRRVECPACGATKVTKAIMAPNVSLRTKKRAVRDVPQDGPAPAQVSAASAVGAAQNRMVVATEGSAEIMAALRKIRQEIVAKADYVGPKFAEEARKIHFDEAPARGIYGEATHDEVRALHEDGVACLPLPVLPEDAN